MTMIIDGTNGLTFNNATTQASAGQILQVVSATYTGDTNTTSGSFSSSNLYATITPKFSTSKIIVLASSSSTYLASNQSISLRIYRGTSGNGSGSSIGAQNYYYQSAASSSAYVPAAFNLVDAPASTSALTYTVMQASANGGNVGYVSGWNPNNLATMILMEIAV
jgi:hypothetical protein